VFQQRLKLLQLCAAQHSIRLINLLVLHHKDLRLRRVVSFVGDAGAGVSSRAPVKSLYFSWPSATIVYKFGIENAVRRRHLIFFLVQIAHQTLLM
jgi:hypothetical protein